MNTSTKTAATLGAGALAIFGLAVGGTVAASATVESTTPTASVVSGSITADSTVEDTLSFMREEERLARDLYAAIADYYDGARPFSMITNSEDHHYDAVGTLLETYGIDDPSAGLEPGTYAFDELQVLYDDLLAQAQTSLTEAYAVGIAIEETDIADLDAALAADYPSDVDAVLTRLLTGSEKHLAAYTSASEGGTAAGTTGRTDAMPGRGSNGADRDGRGDGRMSSRDTPRDGSGRGMTNRDGSCDHS